MASFGPPPGTSAKLPRGLTDDAEFSLSSSSRSRSASATSVRLQSSTSVRSVGQRSRPRVRARSTSALRERSSSRERQDRLYHQPAGNRADIEHSIPTARPAADLAQLDDEEQRLQYRAAQLEQEMQALRQRKAQAALAQYETDLIAVADQQLHGYQSQLEELVRDRVRRLGREERAKLKAFHSFRQDLAQQIAYLQQMDAQMAERIDELRLHYQDGIRAIQDEYRLLVAEFQAHLQAGIADKLGGVAGARGPGHRE